MRSSVFGVVAAIACGVRAAVFPVSPEEGGAGIVRAVTAANAAGGGEVRLASGIYRLGTTLAFTATNVTLRAAEKGGAVLSGARPVTGWQAVAGKPWLCARLERMGYFRSLIVNGQYAPRAEFPGGGAQLQNTNVWKVRWLSSETADSLTVEVPGLVNLLTFKGCENVTFEGIVFENALPPMERSTFSGVGISAAVTGRQVTDCAFKACTFRNCGGIALRLSAGRRLRLEGNTFDQSGSCALQADGRDLFVSGNRMLASGRVFTSAYACNISGQGIRFCANEIDGAPYCGVVFNGEDNLFASNVVRNVMQALKDGAAFYGMGQKTVFRGNRVFDNQPDGKGRHAFYFDEGGRDGLIVDNSVEGGFRSPVHNHFTYNIVVSNNVFKTPGKQGVSFEGSRWGTCVNNRFECGEGFERTPNVCEVTNWSGNVFLAGWRASTGRGRGRMPSRIRMAQRYSSWPAPSTGLTGRRTRPRSGRPRRSRSTATAPGFAAASRMAGRDRTSTGRRTARIG